MDNAVVGDISHRRRLCAAAAADCNHPNQKVCFMTRL